VKLAEKTECSRKDLRNIPAMSSKAAKVEGCMNLKSVSSHKQLVVLEI